MTNDSLMDQLVLKLLIALVGFINWLFQKSAELREKRKLESRGLEGDEAIPEEPKPAPAQIDPDAGMRRLMEALGLPSEAPPFVPPVRIPPPIERPPAFPLAAAPVVSPVPARKTLSQLVKPARPSETPRKQAPSRLHEMLASQDGLRHAIILSEVLGPPKSLRP